MKAPNQGFIDLHTPVGYMLIGISFLVLTFVIAAGAIIARRLSEKDVEMRKRLRASQASKSDEP